MPVLERLHEKYAGKGLLVVGVNVDARGEEARVEGFAESFGITYQIWHDPDDRISTIYRAIGVPATYLIDRQGVVRWRKLGPIAETDTTLGRALDAALADR
jgi:cytochrome c-type biogenesis protein